ncbi:hypothetical protein [Bradyrhizobium sp. AS23.2]|uniref:hypothetical protein n=1 Tax=Bradyrhizobium sp. AS23.2 TaxID=1680155 RepID=UPI00093D69F4|nr:hypothetical protein [Bradyrhizobium sp. AS23.2]OKO72720.1 hypothetical protein AC630_30320 [Bradyrhizobium sp. AS23.2]
MKPGCHRALSAAISFALGVGWPFNVRALDCASAIPPHFESVDASIDPAKKVADLEARAALANLSPIVFSARLAKERLLGGLEAQAPVELLTFTHVRILRGVLPRTQRDGKAIIAYYGWCDASCSPWRRQWRPGAVLTIGIESTSDKVTTIGGETIYHGRIDGRFGPCGGGILSQRQLKLIAAPAEEIARLEREYPRRKAP